VKPSPYSTVKTLSAKTDADGNYKFCSLTAGSYKLVQTNLAGYIDVSDVDGNPLDSTIAVLLAPGASVTDRDFVDAKLTSAPTKPPTNSPTKLPTDSPTKSPTKIPTSSPTKSPTKSPTMRPTKSPTNAPTPVPLGCIGGSVMEDTDNDTIGDKPLAGVTILLTDSSVKPSPYSTVKTLSAKTDADGNYKFCSLTAGSYKLVQTNLAGYIDVSDVDGNPLDSTIAVLLAPGASVTDRDFVDAKLTSAPTKPPTNRSYDFVDGFQCEAVPIFHCKDPICQD